MFVECGSNDRRDGRYRDVELEREGALHPGKRQILLRYPVADVRESTESKESKESEEK